MFHERRAFRMRTQNVCHFVFCWRRVSGAGEQNDHSEHEHGSHFSFLFFVRRDSFELIVLFVVLFFFSIVRLSEIGKVLERLSGV